VRERGVASLSSVSFKHGGQYGYDRKERSTLTFRGGSKSYVEHCAFVKSYNSAIAAVSTSNVRIENNAAFWSLGSTYFNWGSANILKNNLGIWTVSRQLYSLPNGYRMIVASDWPEVDATFDIGGGGSDELVESNTAAGSESIGFRVPGVPCVSVARPRRMIAHGCAMGVGYIGYGGCRQAACAHWKGMRVWRSWAYGIYLHVGCSVKVTDVQVADCTVGVLMSTGGPAMHTALERHTTLANSLVVGSSYGNSDCRARTPTTNIHAGTGHSALQLSMTQVGYLFSSFSGTIDKKNT
jgi:hypothetical protein